MKTTKKQVHEERQDQRRTTKTQITPRPSRGQERKPSRQNSPLGHEGNHGVRILRPPTANPDHQWPPRLPSLLGHPARYKVPPSRNWQACQVEPPQGATIQKLVGRAAARQKAPGESQQAQHDDTWGGACYQYQEKRIGDTPRTLSQPGHISEGMDTCTHGHWEGARDRHGHLDGTRDLCDSWVLIPALDGERYQS